ncbi:MAG TPA: DivIVA domain-containing protein [Acidimicrobiales bacterium]|nr:DivIVA domain-containing protein [Acidimicrobiales bacterium]
MELTPKVFRDVVFREKMRGGYHPEDVDEFLEQAALAAEALQERLRQLTDRAQRAEQAANDATATDEALKRMLLMAQKTADQAVREARDEADRALAEAKRQAALIVADAEERGRRTYEGAITEGRDRMAELERAVAKRQQEVEALQSWVELEKGHLLRVLRGAEEAVANAGMMSEPPDVPKADIPKADIPAGSEQAAGGNQVPGDRVPGDRVAGNGETPHGERDAGDGPAGEPSANARPGGPEGALSQRSSSGGASQGASGDDTGEVVDIADNPGRHAQPALPGQSGSMADGQYRASQGRLSDGEWDPSYLANLGRGTGAEGHSPATEVGPAAAPRTYYPSPGGQRPSDYRPGERGPGERGPGDSRPVDERPGDHRPGDQGAPSNAKPGSGHSPEDDETLAFDERALDSFFSEQELGDERGMGRFRRRS